MAISKHELRLGSQIQHGRVIELKDDVAYVELFNKSRQFIKYADLESLPVTTGYLTIVGFEPHGHEWHRAGLFLMEEPDRGWFMRQDHRYVSNNPITSVHHLENLYQALTGVILPHSIDEE